MYLKSLFSGTAVLGLFFTFTSCGGGEKTEEVPKTDSTATATIDPEIEKMLPLFQEVKEFPYKTDTAFLNHFEAGKDSLVTAQVKLLGGNWFKHALTDGINGQLIDFYMIDSIKAKGAYTEWCESLDIGMTKFANAYPLHKMQLNEKTWILTWVVETASYEACPYFSGTNVYATLIYEGKPAQSFIIGENMGAGDPPSAMSRNLTSEITTDGKIALHAFEESDDMDAEFSTQVRNEYWFEIKDGQFVSVKEEKGKETEVPHPASEEATGE